MKKILFICGSARNGNCKSILEKIQHNFWLQQSTNLVFLRDYNLKPCIGCNKCASDNICINDDRFFQLIEEVCDADIVVLATPNYFYNISGLTKTFVDRSYCLYHSKKLKSKKFIYVYVGEDEPATIKKYLDNAMYGFTVCHELSVLGSYAISAGGIEEFNNPDEYENTINQIISKLTQYVQE